MSSNNLHVDRSELNEPKVAKPKAVVLLSGGLDSATAAAQAIAAGYEPIALSFNYGQRHKRELQSAQVVAKQLGITEHHVIDVNLSLWGSSSLTDKSMHLPIEGLQDNVIPSTYVPGRNTVFIAIALSLAEARSAKAIYLGINAVDYSGYPDCRPDYLEAYQNLAALSSKAALEGNGIELVAPLVMDSKVDIVKKAIALGVPIAATWSCYQGGTEPCGVCDSCRIRDQALSEAGYPELASAVSKGN
ncbi:preQ(0) biosynthesis protein QueC [Thalassoporum mexicanum PCC 7367]|uniref:7-cyano-7-deazaguanine synthase QueC n=1 Tax=Thalassoporum mexicanum TaxID=3457544 RepID=UPI00029FB0DE|nr:7-cyano-7-deazaguanine synthase QueC [Pseudanabaena sp. PCC 7367]AFY70706.1 preQ(0) biosynthesis protein QueC [Pseudanabaena sp. PCC 7367]